MKTALEMVREAGFDTDLPAFREGTALAFKLVEIVATEERERAMIEILAGCPDDGGDVELALRRAWERVRQTGKG